MFNLLAHAGEEHSDTIAGISHYFDTPLNAVLLWIGAVAVAHAAASYALKLGRDKEMLIIAAVHFAIGVFLYNKSAGIGAVVISIGFALTLWLVITGLAVDPKEKKGS